MSSLRGTWDDDASLLAMCSRAREEGYGEVADRLAAEVIAREIEREWVASDGGADETITAAGQAVLHAVDAVAVFADGRRGAASIAQHAIGAAVDVAAAVGRAAVAAAVASDARRASEVDPVGYADAWAADSAAAVAADFAARRICAAARSHLAAAADSVVVYAAKRSAAAAAAKEQADERCRSAIRAHFQATLEE